jgi:hypothetical protein
MDGLNPTSPEWDARSDGRRQRIREAVSAGSDRLTALFNHYSELNREAIDMNNIGVLTRLEAAERRLVAIENT